MKVFQTKCSVNEVLVKDLSRCEALTGDPNFLCYTIKQNLNVYTCQIIEKKSMNMDLFIVISRVRLEFWILFVHGIL